MTLFLSFLVAMFVTMVLIPPLIRGAERWQFVDMPGERKVHSHAVPRIGGIAMVIGTVLPIMLWLSPQKEVIGLLLGMGIILAFGVWDDRCNLDYRIKFFGQILGALAIVVYGGVRIEVLPLFGTAPLPDLVSLPLTIFALLAITNAINLADGLDGLAGGTALLSLGMIALLAYTHDNLAVVLVALAVIGSVFGFLRFNTYPARIFMGDGGSQFLGFSLGALAVMLIPDARSPLSPALPILLLGLPILDTAVVMAQRLYAGRSPFSPDRNHLHHKLLNLGLDHYEAVFIIYVLQAALVMIAYFLRYQADAFILAVYLVFCSGVIVFFRWTYVTQWHVRVPQQQAASYLSVQIKSLRHGGLARWASHIALVTIPAYLFFGTTLAEHVDVDIGVLALILLTLLLGLYIKQHGCPFNWLERAAIYVVSTLVVYLIQVASGPLSDYDMFRHAYLILLAIVVIIGFRFSQEKNFRITPLDFLVIFIAFTVPNLPGLPLPSASVGEGIASLIVLFYGLELILTTASRRWDVLRFVMYTLLAILALRGMVSVI